MIITLLRTIILYALIVTGFRLLGKRQIGELEPTELVLTLIIADLASVPMQDNGIPLLAGIIPIVTLLCLAMIISMLFMKSARFRFLVSGRPSTIVDHGVLNQKELFRNRLTLDELMEELRTQGCTDLKSIRYAILETNGQLSVLLEPSQRPPSARQLGIQTTKGCLPTVLINDGRIQQQNLCSAGYDRNKLSALLSSYGVSSPSEVYLLTVDEVGGIYFAAKEGAS